MNLGDFSDLVLRLNSSAVELSPRAHQDNVIKLLGDVVAFSSAWWGWSNFSGGRVTLVNTGTFQLSRGFESAAKAVQGLDPFVRHGRNLTVFAKSLDGQQPGLDRDFANFLAAFGIGSILNGHCRLGGVSEFNFFMSIYRPVGAPPFSDEQTTDYRIILQHLEQSLSLSLRGELRSLAPAGGDAALLASNGAIVRATRGFQAKLLAEVGTPGAAAALLATMSAQERIWTGSDIMLSSSRYSPGLMLVRQASADLAARLSPAERQVAELLLSGLSMRRIAERKQVSVNTVRNQVASIYRKTDAGGKVGLMQKLGMAQRTKV